MLQHPTVVCFICRVIVKETCHAAASYCCVFYLPCYCERNVSCCSILLSCVLFAVLLWKKRVTLQGSGFVNLWHDDNDIKLFFTVNTALWKSTFCKFNVDEPVIMTWGPFRGLGSRHPCNLCEMVTLYLSVKSVCIITCIKPQLIAGHFDKLVIVGYFVFFCSHMLMSVYLN